MKGRYTIGPAAAGGIRTKGQKEDFSDGESSQPQANGYSIDHSFLALIEKPVHGSTIHVLLMLPCCSIFLLSFETRLKRCQVCHDRFADDFARSQEVVILRPRLSALLITKDLRATWSQVQAEAGT